MNKKLHFFSRSILRSHWFCFTVVLSLPDRWCGICATLKSENLKQFKQKCRNASLCQQFVSHAIE